MNQMMLMIIISLVSCFVGTGVASNHVFVVPDNTILDRVQDFCQLTQCYSLNTVLSNYDKFFTSFTTIELLPTNFLVNDSFGNTTIQNVQEFKMTSASKSNTSNGATISCTEYGSVGFSFLNVTNVTLSNIGFSHCVGDVTIDEMHDKMFLRKKQNLIDLDILYTLVFTYSYNISVSKMAIEYADGIAFAAIGIQGTFLLIRSTLHHNVINCLIVTTDKAYHNYTPHNISHGSGMVQQRHDIIASDFSYGNMHGIASGIAVYFSHATDSVELVISNLTLFENLGYGGNARFEILNQSNVDTRTTVMIDQLFCSQNGYSDDGARVMFSSKFVYLKNLTIMNSKFIRSCLSLHVPPDSVFIQNSTFFDSPCSCLSAIYTIYDDTLLGKCKYCKQNQAANSTVIVFEDVVVEHCCGLEAAISFSHSLITFQGNILFERNIDKLLFQNSHVTLKGNTTFLSNTVYGSSLVLEDCVLYNKGNSVFQSNDGSESGGITLIRSLLELHDKIVFIDNHGHNGGALSLYDSSFISSVQCFFTHSNVSDHCKMIFKGNVAANFGGAIYVDAARYKHRNNYGKFLPNCFTIERFIFEFVNNTADTAGSALYGGWLDFCSGKAKAAQHENFEFIYQTVLQLNNTSNDLSAISSNPSRVCLCFGYQPDCNITIYELGVFPGQSFQIQVVAVGQRFGIVPSTVFAAYENSSTEIDEIQRVQHVGKICTTLNYTVKSPNTVEFLKLYVEKNLIPEPVLDDFKLEEDSLSLNEYKQLLKVFEELKLTLRISKCRLGYSFDTSTNVCTCQKTLTKNGIECHLKNQTIVRRNQMWINATFSHTDSEENNPGVIVHHNCPFDYCKNVNVQYLDLRYPNDQCGFGRSGTLCGECPQNHSHVFGTSKCKKCSNAWTVLVIALFILTGIGLVALLIVLNLTVSIGTINGLIFYAHIVRANHASFFPPQMTNTFLSWFIAWINLDLGIEMCFFDGLDAYIKTWLQFLFPLYIWIIVITIIVSSHYYTFAARLSGSNAVQVLATLFLMSYAKMLRITITALSSTTLDYPDGYSRRVWLYDGSVDYLKGKHIPIFIAALILLILLSIPYTLVLLCIQWLRLLPSYRILFWVRKFKPLFDAYTGVYKRQHGYWTGLLLLVRMGLFLVFALNVLGDPSINLLTMAATTFCVIAYLAIFGGVYRQTHLNLFEYSYILNLGILSAVTVYTRLEEDSQEKVTKTSVGIAFATFILIVCLHAFQRFKSTRKGGLYLRNAQAKFVSPVLDKFKSAKLTQSANATQPNKSESTHSSIVLREPLLVS